ncbi:hypothetical protein [Eisenbergiella porci]|uniref:hypothetical protein n=1 Tax=Eisenbergiella porci TaxID=2652274 RepID=UPI002ED40A37
MMTPTKKVAVPESSIGVDVEQPLHNKDNEIIADTKEHFNRQATKTSTSNKELDCKHGDSRRK